jgi:23S rRNA (cytosine1962-C5)-methyltransferase
MTSNIDCLTPTNWRDYSLLDSGDGLRLERFGAYTLVRPDPEVLWRKRLPATEWDKADATFQHGEGKDRWSKRKPIPEKWPMRYDDLAFFAQLTPFKHTGIFPEQAALWNWMRDKIRVAHRPISVLNLFGYTGLAALSCASAGAKVTYVDASRGVMEWARENQKASQLEDKPIRWIVDDALKFVKREIRRKAQYDAIVLDPPSFGRGPQGEVWKLTESLPSLLNECAALLSDEPLFITLTAYAIEASALALGNVLADALESSQGISVGELVLQERDNGRYLSTAIFTRWHNQP